LNFARPECSRILSHVPQGSEAWAGSLALIREGSQRLNARPRADMDGFVPSESDSLREKKYQERLRTECAVYEALRSGKMVYDTGLPK